MTNSQERNNWDKSVRPQKQDAREYALGNLVGKTHTLWLPGEECHCVKEAFSRNVVSSDSHFIFVERDPGVVPHIQSFVGGRKWEHPPVIFPSDICNLRLPWPLDFAFLDFLGTFDKKTSEWMSQNLLLADGADLCVTHAYGRRYNLFLDRMEVVFTQLEQYTLLRHELCCYNHLITLPLAMMKSMFNRYSFEIRWPCKYKDSIRSMLLFRLEKFHHLHGTNGWPDFLSLVRSEAVSTESAKKAWTTRRRQGTILAKKRSAAARKAWATRRAMAK